MRMVVYGLMILLTVVPPASATTIFKWVDSQGVASFTDDRNKIPQSYREGAITEVLEETSLTGSSVRPQTSLNTDIYGRNEMWWKEKVRPWREELNEATAQYEKLNDKFIEQAEALTRMKYGSRTQVKMKIIQMDRTNDQRNRYEQQIAEARQAIDRLVKEAEESKADPAWLN